MIAFSTIFKYLSLLGSFATIGTLLSMGFLLLDHEGKLSTSSLKLRRLLWGSALMWALGTIGVILFTLANILGQSISVALDPTVLRSFVTQITLGQYLLFEVVVALLVAFFALRIRHILATIFLLILSLVGLVAPVFQSHAESSGSHGLAIGSLVILKRRGVPNMPT